MNTLNLQANLSANCLALGCALITFWASQPPPAFGQIVDQSFNAEPTGIAYGLAVQPDKKIVIGGDVGLRRLNPDGSTDTRFDAGLNPEGQVYAIAVQADGKIVVGGSFHLLGGQAHTNLGRLNPDGSVDATFTAHAGAYSHEWVGTLYLQADGKIFAAGFFNSTAGQALRGFIRLNPDGNLDPAFNPAIPVVPSAIAMQPDGKILIGSTGVSRLHSDGSLDSDFIPVQGDAFFMIKFAVQPDGKIVVIEAIGAGAGPEAIAKALDGIRRGDADSLNGNGDNAVQRFFYAWRQAIRLDD